MTDAPKDLYKVAAPLWRDGHPTIYLLSIVAGLTIAEYVRFNSHMSTCEPCAAGWRELTGVAYKPMTPQLSGALA